MRWLTYQYAIKAAARAGGPRALDAAWGRRLTVLVYHRVVPPGDDSVFEPGLVSASPSDFDAQMAWIASRFDPIGLDDLRDLVGGRIRWPRRPLAITFDDGYADNYLYARPVLKARGLPAAVFVVSDRLGTDVVPWWDRLAQLIEDAPSAEVDLPLIGRESLRDAPSRDRVRIRLADALKAVPDPRAAEILDDLPRLLGAIPRDPTAPLFMSWEQAATMRDDGIRIESHTARHPILTRIDESRVKDELERSARRIEKEIGERPLALAYPNGRAADVDDRVVRETARCGYSLAFTMDSGPSTPDEVRAEPLRIRRVPVEAYDDMDRFRLKAMGAVRLSERARHVATRARSRGQRWLAGARAGGGRAK